MGRYLLGVASALLLVAAGLFVWKSVATAGASLPDAPPPPLAAPAGAGPALADPPQATARTREERRFARYDRDKDGRIAREEYLAARRKAYARLDSNSDGRLSFEEYAARTAAKFAGADGDRSGALDATEFVKTRVVRKARARPDCPPAAPPAADEEG